ncbi:MAG TPA: HAD-IA family hydrolase [Devosiaceae bacterium]|jgi:phosphoglycolate phosphatase|nr:HAD-IA family hydrolase [Devosiaceae bacterium]
MKLIVFDVDGTLIDSVALIVQTVTNAFEAIDEPVPSETAIRSISGITARDAMALLAPAAPPERVDQILESYRTHYRRGAGVTTEPLFAGALAALDRLQQRPDTILAVATGKGYRGAVTLLERHAILDRFHSIETPDHNRGKPDPQMIETAMTKAGASKSETVMIGDTIHDMRMARAAGVHAIGVAWGYHEVTELVAAGADTIVESFAELDGAIDGLLAEVH